MRYKTAIFTRLSLDPLHTRLELLMEVLQEAKYDIEIVDLKAAESPSLIVKLASWLTLGFFDIISPIYYINTMRKTNIVYIQDMRFLFLLPIAKLLGKKTVYETLDNFPYYVFYGLCLRYPFLRRYSFIEKIVAFLERLYVTLFADAIIVNSEQLFNNFHKKATLLFYASPLETLDKLYNPNKAPAFVYLGIISPEKGIHDIIAIQKQYDIPVFLFGNLSSNETALSQHFAANESIIYKNRMDSLALAKELQAIMKQYALIGFSLIKPVHFSYATQEANKDIDYLALGIPIIGNHRGPTAEKIRRGCGVFVDDEKVVQRLVGDKLFRRRISQRCKDCYDERYSQRLYKEGFLNVLHRLES